MNRPIIGIVGKHYKENLYPAKDTVIRDEMKQAVLDNGGLAIGLLSPCREEDTVKFVWENRLAEEEKQILHDEISLCDGIILAGGTASEQFEIYTAKYCHEQNIPLLGICAGFQNMVRAMGGETGPLGHQKHQSQNPYVHSVAVEQNSFLCQILKQESVMVNSKHIYHVLSAGSLQISALAEDQVIEAVEDRKKDFFVGLQFHPECLYLGDRQMNRVFEVFISAAKGRKK